MLFQKQSVLILEDPIPKEPSIYLEQKLTGTVSSIFDNGNVFRRVTHTPDLPNGSGASSDALTSGQVDGAATTKEDDAGRAANLNLPAILGGAGTACILLFVALWCNMRVPSREKPNPDFVYEDDANGYFIPNVDRAKEPRQSALTMQQMAEMDEQAERCGGEGRGAAGRMEGGVRGTGTDVAACRVARRASCHLHHQV